MRESKLLYLPSKTWTTTGCFVEGLTSRIVCVCMCPRGYQGCACVREGMKNRNYVKKWVCTCVREQTVCVRVCVHERDTDRQAKCVCVCLNGDLGLLSGSEG